MEKDKQQSSYAAPYGIPNVTKLSEVFLGVQTHLRAVQKYKGQVASESSVQKYKGHEAVLVQRSFSIFRAHKVKYVHLVKMKV